MSNVLKLATSRACWGFLLSLLFWNKMFDRLVYWTKEIHKQKWLPVMLVTSVYPSISSSQLLQLFCCLTSFQTQWVMSPRSLSWRKGTRLSIHMTKSCKALPWDLWSKGTLCPEIIPSRKFRWRQPLFSTQSTNLLLLWPSINVLLFLGTAHSRHSTKMKHERCVRFSALVSF